mmetsp:Transcript_158240/g.279301  ORF Transcript_158240/g.279301 Transcript_158240/m.279301 type:complete len:449 (+) Transcript_158240:117-1463(+)
MLPTPKTEKELEDGVSSSGGWAFGVASMQGWRLRMEDSHLALPDFDLERKLGLFGVFDGHGGAAVAQVAAERLPAVLRGQPALAEGNYPEALYETFMQLDKFLDSSKGRKEVIQRTALAPPSEEDDSDEDCLFAEEEGEEEEEELDPDDEDMDEDDRQMLQNLLAHSEADEPTSNDLWCNGQGPDCCGCTAVVALVCGGEEPKVFVANAGDSRGILISGRRGKPLSKDHKPMLKSERERIMKAGGFVGSPEEGGRVDGNLSLSRAFGDFAYKKNRKLKPTEQKITCEPEIRCHKLDPADRYVVLGCDGIWEKASNQDVTRFLLQSLSGGPTGGTENAVALSQACAKFLDANLAPTLWAYRGLGCDNMTLMAIDLLANTAPPSAPTATPVTILGNKPRAVLRLKKFGAKHGVLSNSLVSAGLRAPVRRKMLVLQRWLHTPKNKRRTRRC